MQSIHDPAFFDLGPRTFRGAPQVKRLAKELGLSLVEASPEAKTRYIFWNGKLHSVPPKKSQLFSPIGRVMLGALFRDLFTSAYPGDETIGAFARRRFGKKAAELFFDPLVKGVFAGDLDRLSIQECLPKIKEWEREKGSVVRGMGKKAPEKLFTIEGGTGALTTALAENLDVVYDTRVTAIYKDGVETTKGPMMADYVISALPVSALQKIESPYKALFSTIETVSLTVVNFTLPKTISLPSAFGYLVPRLEKSEILGMVFDSQIFPNNEKVHRLTAMLENCNDVEGKLTRSLKKHLGIEIKPTIAHVKEWREIMPQYTPGHSEKIALLEEDPNSIWLGNYLAGASVNACIEYAEKQLTAHPLLDRLVEADS